MSHKVYSYKSILDCINCGSYAINKLRKLATDCKPRAEAGQLFLDNLNKGILPPSVFSHLEEIALANIKNYINSNAIPPIATAPAQSGISSYITLFPNPYV